MKTSVKCFPIEIAPSALADLALRCVRHYRIAQPLARCLSILR